MRVAVVPAILGKVENIIMADPDVDLIPVTKQMIPIPEGMAVDMSWTVVNVLGAAVFIGP